MISEMNIFFNELQKFELTEKNIQHILKLKNNNTNHHNIEYNIPDNNKIDNDNNKIDNNKIDNNKINNNKINNNKIDNNKIDNNKIDNNKIDNNKIDNNKIDICIPKEKDKLFWCFYLIKNGELKYELIDNKSIITEKQLKIGYVEKLRNYKQIIKQYKFTTLSNIENNLANEDKISINTFLTLCVIENINVYLIKKNTYYELCMNDSNDIFLIYVLNNGKFGYEKNINKTDNIKSTFFKLDNMEKPIKSITYYKVSDLLEICNKLSIETINKETNKSKSKKDLYEDIIKTF